jgi:hypothetical protein
MADAYFYSSAAQQMQLSGSVNGSTSSIIVDTVTGLPSTTPFKLVIDPGLGTEEIVKVTEVSGTTLTVVRGWDGTSGQAHGNLAEVRHMVTAEDLRLSRQHEDDSAAVHGTTGSVVGTTDTQVLTNKDLTSPTNTFPSSLATDNEVSSAVNAHASSTTTHGVTGNVVGTASTQTLTNKNLTSSTNSFPSTLATTAALTAHTSDTAAHGATGGVVGATKTQTLTGKTMSGASNTFTAIPESAITGLTTDLAALSAADTALDARLDALEQDTGILTTALTAAAGWTINTQQLRRVGDLVQVYLLLTRSGSAISAASSGNIVNVELATINSSIYFPVMPTGGSVVANGIMLAGYAWTDGGIGIGALPPGVGIATSDQISLSLLYLI